MFLGCPSVCASVHACIHVQAFPTGLPLTSGLQFVNWRYLVGLNAILMFLNSYFSKS